MSEGNIKHFLLLKIICVYLLLKICFSYLKATSNLMICFEKCFI